MTSLPDAVGGVVLAGGTAVRLDGADKACLDVGGRTLLECALAALADVAEVVVVGEEVPTSRPVTFRREEPPGSGPAAGLVAGLTGFTRTPEVVVALAVDMPLVTAATVRRLLDALPVEGDGAVLVDGEGHRQTLCAAYRVGALQAAAAQRRTGAGTALGTGSGHGLSMRHLVAELALEEVPATGLEAADVDTWEDLVRLREATQR